MMGLVPSALPDGLLTLAAGDGGFGTGGLTSLTVGTVCGDGVALFGQAAAPVPLTGPLGTGAPAPADGGQLFGTALTFGVRTPSGPL